MVGKYMQPQEMTVFSRTDLAAIQTVFDTVKDHATLQGDPDKLHALARSVFTLYQTTEQEPDRLVRLLLDSMEAH